MSDSAGGPQKVEGLTGVVVQGSFGVGSKSEREGIWLETENRRLVLRRKDGPVFQDQALQKYVGKRVKCDGFIVDYMLLTEHIEVMP